MISSSENSLFIAIYHTLRSFTLTSSTKVHQDTQVLAALPEIHDQLLQAIIAKDDIVVMSEMQNHIRITHDKLYAAIGKARD